MKIRRVEIVTVSATGARVNWRTNRPGEFEATCSAPGSTQSHTARVESVSNKYHLAVFEDLEPNTTYTLHIRGSGALHKETFKTLKPPPGEFRFRFATINDIHIGEKVYGLIYLPGLPFPLTPGLKLDIDGAPFWKYTNEAAIRELNRLDLDFVIVKGDLVTDHTQENIAMARAMLDTLAHPYTILRGNHDRGGRLPRDWFATAFEPEHYRKSFEHKGCGFLLMENITPDTGYTRFSKSEIEWFSREMQRLAHVPVFVFMHNPPLRKLERARGHRINEFLEILDAHPCVAGVFYGHTHGNKRIIRRGPHARVPFVETAATMDYPGGYNVYDVHAGGYTQTCIRPHDASSYRWYQECEKAYYGLARDGLFGKINHRNFSWKFPEQRMGT